MGATLVKRLLIAAFLLAASLFVYAAFDEPGARFRPHQGGEPEQVFFGMYLLDVDDISGENQNFTINLMLRLRWKDERLAHSGDSAKTMPLSQVWNPRPMLVNRQALMRTPMPEIVEVEPDGTVLYRQQYVGQLSQELHLTHFPIDTQDFYIHFIAMGYHKGEIEFVPEIFSKDGNIVGGDIAKSFSLPDWQIISYAAKPMPYEMSRDIQLVGFAFVFTAKRYFLFYFWQIIFPMILIVMMSWSPFWVDPSLSGTQISLAASSMLTVIAYRFVLANLLPRLPYMTRMDYFSLVSTLLVFIAFSEVVITSLLAKSNRKSLGVTFDRYARMIFPIVYAIFAIGCFVW